MSSRRWWSLAVALSLALAAAPLPAAAVAPPTPFGDGMCSFRARACPVAPRLAVFGAFPGEIVPLLRHAQIAETLLVGNRVLRIGTLDGVPVVIGLLGIGMVNAAATTNLILDRFPVEAIVISGVAGAPHRIADVTAPAVWMDESCARFDTDPGFLALANEIVAAPPMFEHCTPDPQLPPGGQVCLDYQPALFVGGEGLSSDDFPGALRCDPGSDPVFACDVEPRPAGRTRGVQCPSGTGGFADQGTEDMETGAVAREATRRGVPFIAFRALSDGDGDPLGLPGFPTQFFKYYALAAENAAAATRAFVVQWAAGSPPATIKSATPVPRASCDWTRRATAVCDDAPANRGLTQFVDRACRLTAAASKNETAIAKAWCRTGKQLQKRPVQKHLGAACASALATIVSERCN